VKIVFLLRHALYLRNFENALRELAMRSHEILIVFSPWQKPVDKTLFCALMREYPNIREQRIAPRTGWGGPGRGAARANGDCSGGATLRRAAILLTGRVAKHSERPL